MTRAITGLGALSLDEGGDECRPCIEQLSRGWFEYCVHAPGDAPRRDAVGMLTVSKEIAQAIGDVLNEGRRALVFGNKRKG